MSAGYDAAEGDALGGCHVTPAGFAHMTHMLSSLCDGKLVLALEVSAYSDSSRVRTLTNEHHHHYRADMMWRPSARRP